MIVVSADRSATRFSAGGQRWTLNNPSLADFGLESTTKRISFHTIDRIKIEIEHKNDILITFSYSISCAPNFCFLHSTRNHLISELVGTNEWELTSCKFGKVTRWMSEFSLEIEWVCDREKQITESEVNTKRERNSNENETFWQQNDESQATDRMTLVTSLRTTSHTHTHTIAHTKSVLMGFLVLIYAPVIFLHAHLVKCLFLISMINMVDHRLKNTLTPKYLHLI